MSGFFLVTRGISKHPLFKRKPDRLAVWMWLLDNVAFKDTTQDAKGKTVAVPRGSVCVSLRHIADETGVGLQVVRTALKRFETEHMVNTKVTHGKTVVSLCNYEKHQRSDDAANTAPNTTLTQHQHKPNTQKKQGNKETKDTNVSLDACTAEILSQAVSQDIAKEFIAARREMKKPVTERAARSMVEQLSGHHDPNAVIRSSISNGWQGIFPDKIKPQFKTIPGGQDGTTPSKSAKFVTAFVGGAAGSS
ncbi:hypothetical protein JQW92_18160 [Sulfitobacter pseudonitzschiae]|uniref:hypothetical protein n=1 Tax=Pseudosulfitobacter pseudonitzschiae TaxID=1402135 RepID=UPI001AF72607|nr:hypothetical protein [Pseudosulfitobacter pseudonitzschiae]MBM1817172.1 hypothetical protein [Pseudosulfitobacter pseudonitzschiae]MBM1834183.1 hypothetical protein [Pseudosulfitobacter pseudonitzschiae]MBM1839048.1 hypothetical protein [Pseudosulfitobacter pseudonitzschiae]MBM1843896.1 hypothetical protein [Pseudosulfitobacter pseudonitzschiae]MBM1858446.1 hypothetical protein [Pseudosulfitobacter pseudonitzschiae]